MDRSTQSLKEMIIIPDIHKGFLGPLGKRSCGGSHSSLTREAVD